jgi:ABC-type transport system involved in cytochrome bd biosynthesis fused ATPase/permease subunit
MDFDQSMKLVGAVAAALTVVVTIGVTLSKALNRKSAAYERASESLGLLKAWDELPLDTDAPEREKRARAELRDELVERAHLASQSYLNASRPIFTSQWQGVIVFVVGFAFMIWLMINPLTGSLQNPVSLAAPYVVVLVALALSLLALHFAQKHQEDKRSLKRAQGRAAKTAEVGVD